MHHCRLTLLLMACALLGACEKPSLIRPPGFAEYADREQGYKAVSPDRVLYRVRSHDNEEKGDLAFWKIALKTHMLDSGYLLLEESAITADAVPGYQLLLAAPVGVMDYNYLIALFVHKSKLVVIEAAGETEYFSKHRESILQTIRNTAVSAYVD